ncbi:MAG: hypothetical protein WDA28_13160 [Castellaniella sp.]
MGKNDSTRLKAEESDSESGSGSSDSDSGECNITVQYGIFVDIEFDDLFDELIGEYCPEILDDYKLAPKSTIVRSYNGNDDASQVGIVVAEMGIDGPTYDGGGASMMIDPAKLIELEDDHREAIEYISDLHEKFVGRFKARKINPREELQLGWNVSEALW